MSIDILLSKITLTYSTIKTIYSSFKQLDDAMIQLETTQYFKISFTWYW